MKIFKRYTAIAALMIAALPLQAQFTNIDWEVFGSDSLLPHYTTVIDLEEDFARYSYSATIEYPEFQPMSKAEIGRFGLEALRDSIPSYPSVTTHVGISAKRGQLDVSFIPIVYHDGKYQRINSFKLKVNRSPLSISRIASRASAAERYSASSVLSEGRWVKIAVSKNGVHKITDADLKKLGFKNPSKVRLFGYGGGILPEKDIHKLTDDLKEVPLWRENGYMLFYANGTVRWEYSSGRYIHKQNVYSNYSFYFLNESDAEPMAFPEEELTTTNKETYTTYPDYALYEKEEKSLCIYGRTLLGSYDFASGRTVSYKFDIDGIIEGRAAIELAFGSEATSSSRVTVDINGETAGYLNIEKAAGSSNGRIAQTQLWLSSGIPENPTIKLSHTVSDQSMSGYLDYIRLNFNRKLALRGSSTNFRGNSTSGNATYKIASATSSTHVWRVTEADEIAELTGTFSDGILSVVAPASRNEEFVAVDVNGTFPSVMSAGVVANQNLHALGQTDMVIIVPTNGDFIQPAERLAQEHRNRDGLSVVVVTAEQVYNEFSSGTPDATAYRRLMKMLYDRAETAEEAPKHLLLFGDGLTDNRTITSRRSQDDYLLTYQSENSVSAVDSYVLEDYFAFLDDSEGGYHTRDKMDIGVGRLPVQNIGEANAVVDKLITYMRNEHAGAWQNVISLLGDDGDRGTHMQDSENIAQILVNSHPSYMLDRIYWDDYPVEMLSTGASYPMVTEAIYKRLEEGALLVDYSGHGSANVLSHEQTWKASDMASLTSPRIPFWVTASCDITPFDMGDNSLGETAMLNPNGAAVGLLTTTRTVLQSYNAVINKQFVRRLMAPGENGEVLTVGEALRLAKCDIIASGGDLSENKLQYVLIGDPALRLNMPRYKVVVESFNGASTESEGKVPAGGVVTVEGRITMPDGTPATSFTGTISPTLFDCVENVTTLNNRDEGAFKYRAYRKKLFTGSDSVVAGRFKLSMPVPLDISYMDEQGMLNLFAVDSAGNSAQGHYDNFTVGGTASSIQNDGKGPEITMYLNKSDFINGDEVNSTPRLFAKLFDENGINIVGTGIGHDIVAMVDNDPDRTYNLNNLYKPVVGDYRSGTVELSIDELAEGEHTLLLRAWDLYNNSSTDTLHFVVVKGLAPDFTDIKVSPNPIEYGESAIFSITHDRPGSELDVTIELYNFQGQLLWDYNERAHSATNIYSVSWDATTASGQPLPTGVYLYRATISSEGGTERTKTRKLIVLNNK